METDAHQTDTARTTAAKMRETKAKNARWVLWAQQKLAYQSCNGEPFTRLRHLLEWPRLVDLAVVNVLTNTGARTPGIDGKTKEDYRTWEQHKALRDSLIQDFRRGTYRPSPVRRVHVDKPNKPGQKRPLGIATIRDRVAQECLRLILEPIYEGEFHPHSYGFRPFRSTHHAMVRLWDLTNNSAQCEWIIEGDIRGFFDHVDHETLLSILERKVGDRRILGIIRTMLKAGVLEAGALAPTDEGTPQGSILSPLLANVYLNDLDHYVAQKYEALPSATRHGRTQRGQTIPYFIVRYADDFCVAVRGTRDDAEALKRDLAEYLQKHLNLELSEEKTKVTHIEEGLDFLGFHFRKEGEERGREVVLVRPTQKAKRKFRDTVHETVRLAHSVPDALWITSLNAIIRGWGEYYRRVSSSRTFASLDNYVWWRVFRTTYAKQKAVSGRQSRRQHYRRHYLPYRYDSNPAVRRHKSRNYGVWLDPEEGVALIVQSLTHLPIVYVRKHPQGNPYVPEERAKLEANRELARLQAELTPPPEWWNPTYGPEWPHIRAEAIRRAKGRCQRCGTGLKKGRCEVHHKIPPRNFRHTRAANVLDNLEVLCKRCHGQRHQDDSEGERKPSGGEPDARKRAHPVRAGVSGNVPAQAG